MKTMTCKQLGGACETKFTANSFEEIAELSKKHGMEMYQKQDAPHLKAIEEMQSLMQSPEEMQKWMQDKKELFESLPNN
ncbi:DUF1059 domain-containing protein [Flagellimonas sp.]|uniref:DUF1059 domain-containing protein n=1 Tax=Flagellimonas sp. TaxID=2058762 RepID=UPI003B5025C2